MTWPYHFLNKYYKLHRCVATIMIKIQEQQDENPDDLNQSNSLQDLDVHLNLHSLKKGHPDRPVVSAYGARYHSADKI